MVGGGKVTDKTTEGDRKKSERERSKRRGPPQHPPEDTAGEKEDVKNECKSSKTQWTVVRILAVCPQQI